MWTPKAALQHDSAVESPGRAPLFLPRLECKETWWLFLQLEQTFDLMTKGESLYRSSHPNKICLSTFREANTKTKCAF